MTGIVDICNFALEELRAAPIINITDANPRAEACNRFYNTDRKYTLRAHSWNFAIKRSEQLGTLDNSPTFEFQNYHQLPDDLIRILSVHYNFGTDLTGSSSVMHSHQYAVEGKKIASNQDNIFIRYIWDIQDVNSFDEMFIRCLSLKLASSIAAQITGNSSLKGDMYQLYLDCLEEAKSIDGQERPPIIIRRSDLVDARRRFTGRNYGTKWNGCGG